MSRDQRCQEICLGHPLNKLQPRKLTWQWLAFPLPISVVPGFYINPWLWKKNCNWRFHPTKGQKNLPSLLQTLWSFPGTFFSRLGHGADVSHPPAFSSHGRSVFRESHATRGEVEASRAAEKGGEPGDTRDGYPRQELTNQLTNQPTTTTTTRRRTRWWFQTFFSFVNAGEMIQFDDHLHIFQMVG